MPAVVCWGGQKACEMPEEWAPCTEETGIACKRKAAWEGISVRWHRFQSVWMEEALCPQKAGWGLSESSVHA